MTLQNIVLIGVLIIAGLFQVFGGIGAWVIIGKERKPVTASSAAAISTINAVFAVTIFVAAWKLH